MSCCWSGPGIVEVIENTTITSVMSPVPAYNLIMTDDIASRRVPRRGERIT